MVKGTNFCYSLSAFFSALSSTQKNTWLPFGLLFTFFFSRFAKVERYFHLSGVLLFFLFFSGEKIYVRDELTRWCNWGVDGFFNIAELKRFWKSGDGCWFRGIFFVVKRVDGKHSDANFISNSDLWYRTSIKLTYSTTSFFHSFETRKWAVNCYAYVNTKWCFDDDLNSTL